MEQYRYKIGSARDVATEAGEIKSKGKKVVFTNGCFDLLHPGHTRYLYAARQLGDYLIVGINSDRSVRSIKGPGRPVQSEEARTEVVAALGFVNRVVLFDEDTPLKLIELILPDFLVKGGDWREEDIVGADIVRKAGGQIRAIPYVPGFSTTGLLNNSAARDN